MIVIYGCDEEEARAFTDRAKRLGLIIEARPEALSASGAQRAPIGCAVSVSHNASVDRTILNALHSRGVRYLSARSVGTDHIDTVYARRLGIAVENVAYSPESVAEHAIMLMLMALRDAPAQISCTQSRDFSLPPRRYGTLMNSTVGIIGAGRIGRCVAKRLRGFGCNVLGYDPHPSAEIHCVPLDVLLRRSDIITLHLPLTQASRRLIGREALERMKPGAYLINTARGALVDSDALADALEAGHIAAAALDVAEGEEGWFYRDCSKRGEPPFSRLLSSPNVILTPHSAFYTRAALSDIVENTLENCMNYGEAAEKWIV